MKLSLVERIRFGNLLPERGDLLAMTVKEQLIQKVHITPEEFEKWDIKTTDGMSFTWDKDKAEEVEIDFTEPELSMIRAKLKELETNKELDDTSYGFHKKFIN